MRLCVPCTNELIANPDRKRDINEVIPVNMSKLPFAVTELNSTKSMGLDCHTRPL